MGRDRQLLGEWYADGLRFTCTQCGNCCTGPQGYVWFNADEARAIADYLGLSVEQFHARHAHKVGRRWTLNEHRTKFGYDCVFLTRDANGKAGCSIYPVRPTQCRTWPFWPENLATPDNYMDIAGQCPGVKRGLEGRGELVPIEQVRIRRDQTRG
jgi:hypothetical protein